MKKQKKQPLKTAFQTMAAVCAQIAAENQVEAARSAGILYDNVASGLTLQKVKNLFKAGG